MVNENQYEKAGAFQMPKASISSKEKDHKYHLAIAKAIFNLYVSNSCSIPYKRPESTRTFGELRLYAEGKQPIQKYKDVLFPQGSWQKKVKKSLSNISYDNSKILPKFLRSAVGVLLQKRIDVNVRHIDPDSQKERKELENYLKWKTKPEFKRFSQVVGRSPSEDKTRGYPEFENPKQVETFVKSGGLMLEREVELWKLLQSSAQDGDMDGLLLKHAYDILTLGCIASYDYLDSNTHKVLPGYVDPDRAIVQHSIYEDHHDIDFAGFHEEKTIGYIRDYKPIGPCPKLSDTEIHKIAQLYASEHNNPRHVLNSGSQEAITRNQAHAVNGFKVTVATFYITDQDIERHTEAKHKSGNLMVNTVDPDYKLDKREEKAGKKIFETKPTYTRFIKWIVGSDYLLDYGIVDYAPRQTSDKRHKAKIPFHFYRTPGPSFVESCVGFVDDLQISLLKLRNTKAKMPPAPSMVIRKKYLENITLGGVKITPLDALDIFGEGGTLLINDTDDFGNPNQRGAPVDFLPSGVAEHLRILREDINYQIEQIRLTTGINELVDATTPSPEQGLGVANIAVDATNNTLYTTSNALIKHHEQIYYSMASRWQSVILFNDIEARYLPNGEITHEVFKVSKRQSIEDLGIIIELRSGAAERNMLIQQILELRAKRTQSGNGGITEADFVYISRIISSGNLNLAQLVLAELVEQRKLEDMEIAAITMENTAKAQRESNQATVEGEIRMMEKEYALKKSLIITEEEERRKTIALEKGIIPEIAQQNQATQPTMQPN